MPRAAPWCFCWHRSKHWPRRSGSAGPTDRLYCDARRQAIGFPSPVPANAPWSRAAEAVRVFKIYSQFANTASDAELRTTFADLRRRHIALALEAGLMTPSDKCGHQVEGFGGPVTAGRIAERICRAGGDLRYIAMDEPLWFGHQYSGANACRMPIGELARNVAANAAIYQRVFPAVRFGDIEPFGLAEAPGWVDEVMQWAQAYRDAACAPLAFFDVDVAWTGPWRRQMPLLARRLRTAGIRFGIIYDGDPSDQTGLAWTRHAEERFVAVESGLEFCLIRPSCKPGCRSRPRCCRRPSRAP